jgi:hypothetical protein
MKIGCTMRPTQKSERAKLPIRTLDGVWSEGVVRMAKKTSKLAMILETADKPLTILRETSSIPRQMKQRFSSYNPKNLSF